MASPAREEWNTHRTAQSEEQYQWDRQFIAEHYVLRTEFNQWIETLLNVLNSIETLIQAHTHTPPTTPAATLQGIVALLQTIPKTGTNPALVNSYVSEGELKKYKTNAIQPPLPISDK